MKKEELLGLMEDRFELNREHFPGLEWGAVKAAIEKSDQMEVLFAMEETGGEPELVKVDEEYYYFFDCAAESPVGRRSICYDQAAWDARKANKPESSMEKMAAEIGAEALNEDEYMFLQSLGEYDVKSQSWILTDQDFRAKGEAIFGSKRHGRTFLYYNGVQSYYKNRGFRCKVKIAR